MKQLRCEYQVNPLGIDTARPRLSWQLPASGRGVRQTAYRILVASSDALLKADTGDLWDSGRVESAQSFGIEYAGRALRSRTRYGWKVKVWSSAGEATSEPAWWETALLPDQDWQGVWIRHNRPAPGSEAAFYEDQAAPLLRRPFRVEKKMRRARAYISGLGYYELRINGRKIGDQVLDPGWTSYSRRVLYATHDITAALQPGDNVAGVILGNGWYNPLPLRMWGHLNLREHLTVGQPRLIAEFHLDYEDGSSERIVSDGTWKTADSPILRNSVYLGEVYDARKEAEGWDRPGFDDHDWTPAVAAAEPVGKLRCQSAPPIRVGRTLTPVAVTEPAPGLFVFDLGENIAGSIRLRVRGPRGQTVTATCGELLDPDGRVNARTSACGQIKKGRCLGGAGAPENAFHRYQYTLKGDGEEVYTPRFAYSGFRYVEVEGYPGRPDAAAVEGRVMHADVASAGGFECSNGLFNRIQAAFRRSLLSNLFSVQSDCPHREKFGYGGDMVACSEAAVYNFDLSLFYAKAVEDLADAVRPNGGFTETAPHSGVTARGLGEGSGPMLWGTAHPVLQERLLAFYGNERLLSEQYDTTRRWFELLAAAAEDHIIKPCLGDHESLAPNSPEVSNTSYYYHTALAFSAFCRRLGKAEEAGHYAGLAERIRESFIRHFLDPATGRCKDGTQANQSFALVHDLVPEPLCERVMAVLVDDVMNRNGGHLTTGIFGTDCLLQALSAGGRVDVAYTVVNQETFPGWGWMFANGATTLWEHWEKDEETFSHNHPMFGSVSAWFLKYLAGIRPAEGTAGFEQVVIAPRIPQGLTWVQGHHESIHGRVVSHWKREGDRLTMDVVIPPNTTATVHVPARDAAAVMESGRPAAQAPGVEFLRLENGAAVFRLGSGTYAFASDTRVTP